MRIFLPSLSLALATVLFTAFAGQGQEPPQGQEPGGKTRPAPPPPDAALLPPIDEPFIAPVPRSDVLLRFDRPDPLEGFYQLRRRLVEGIAQVRQEVGYLAIGKQLLFLQVSAQTGTPELPLLRASVYRWRRAGQQVQLSVLLSHYNDTDGQIHLEPQGSVDLREIEQLGDVLRIYQDKNSFLEFTRAE